MTDLIVVGAGLAGMFAGALAARRGLDTIVIARGIGGTHISAGMIGVHGYAQHKPIRKPAPSNLGEKHPYSRFTTATIATALEKFSTICSEQNLNMLGDLHTNHWLPTAIGATHAACLVPESMLAGDLRNKTPMLIGRLPGFRDFYPELLTSNLGHDAVVVDLPVPGAPRRRESYATDLAHLLDAPDSREGILLAWREAIDSLALQSDFAAARLGVPAILGIEQAHYVWQTAQTILEREVFEIPIMPPSVPGMRIFNALHTAILAKNGRLVLGPTVQGAFTRHGSAHLSAAANGRERKYKANAILLATGGFAHGGLESESPKTVHESVFDLPVVQTPKGKSWSRARYLDAQPFARLGVETDATSRALDSTGAPIADNLWACGSLLAGADRMTEGSREGIALSSAFAAVGAIVAAAG